MFSCKMRSIVVSAILLLSFSAMAFEEDTFKAGMQQMIDNGMLTNEQAEEALKKFRSMSKSEREGLKKAAESAIGQVNNQQMGNSKLPSDFNKADIKKALDSVSRSAEKEREEESPPQYRSIGGSSLDKYRVSQDEDKIDHEVRSFEDLLDETGARRPSQQGKQHTPPVAPRDPGYKNVLKRLGH